MSRHTKPGRNDLCACGSGKKRKNCCEAKAASQPGRGSRVLIAGWWRPPIVGAVAAGVLSSASRRQPAPAPGKVWSPEHGHYH